MRNFSNINTSSNSASLLEIFLTNVLLHDPMIAFVKFSKYWLKLTRYSTFTSSSFMFSQNSLELICASCYLYLLIGNLNQNAYSGTFSYINHELKVKTFRN